MKELMIFGAALLLSACGSDSNGPATPVTPPLQPPDAFYMRLAPVVGNAPEDSEPVDVSGLGLTEPEDTEPVDG